MKIKVKDSQGVEVIIDSRAIQTTTCRAGAYYQVYYTIKGETIYSADAGLSGHAPSAIEVLDRNTTQRIKCPENTSGARKWSGAKPDFWALDVTKTNREWFALELDKVVLVA